MATRSFIQAIAAMALFSLAQAAAPSGVSMAWDFDGGEPLRSSSGEVAMLRGRHSGITEGIRGKAVEFDGEEDYLEVVLPEANRPREELTLSYWICPARGSAQFSCVRHANTCIAFNGQSGFAWAEVKREDGSRCVLGYSTPSRLPAGRWYHLALTYSQKELAVWLDGVKIGSQAVKTPGVLMNTTQPLRIGGHLSRYNSQWTKGFRGRLDELQILPVARTDFPEIRARKTLENIRRYAEADPHFHALRGRLWEAKDAAALAAATAAAQAYAGRVLGTARREATKALCGENAADFPYALTITDTLQRHFAEDFVPPTATALKVRTAGNEREGRLLHLFPVEAGELPDVGWQAPATLTDEQGRKRPFRISLMKVRNTAIPSPSAFLPPHREIPDGLEAGTLFSMEPQWPFTVLYCEVQTPAGTPKGRYRGVVTLEAGEAVLSLPLEVHVAGFSLPQEQIVPTFFNIWERAIASYVQPTDADGFLKLLEAYAVLLAEHRMAPRFLGDQHLLPRTLRQAVAPDFLEGEPSQLQWKAFDALVAKLHGLGVRNFCVGPFYANEKAFREGQGTGRAAALWREVGKHVAGYGFGDSLFLAYPFDEPGAKWEAVNEAMALIHKNATQLKTLVTGGSANYPDPAVQGVDVWVPQLHWTNYAQVRKEQAAGHVVWSYVCTGPQFPYPNLHVDTPPAAIRASLWCCMRFGFQGFLHWAVNFNTEKNRRKYETVYGAGEGTYIQAAKDGSPVPTLRLKLLCDGLEEWTALEMLRRRDAAAYAKLKGEFDELFRMKEHDPGFAVTFTAPREASFHTFLGAEELFDLYGHTARMSRWRERLYQALEQRGENDAE